MHSSMRSHGGQLYCQLVQVGVAQQDAATGAVRRVVCVDCVLTHIPVVCELSWVTVYRTTQSLLALGRLTGTTLDDTS